MHVMRKMCGSKFGYFETVEIWVQIAQLLNDRQKHRLFVVVCPGNKWGVSSTQRQ